MLKRTAQIRQALLELNFPKVKHELSKYPITSEICLDLLELTRQLGVLAVSVPDAKRTAQRDAFIGDFQRWIDRHAPGDFRPRLDEMERQARLCESVFRLILTRFEQSPTGRMPLSIAIWTVVASVAKDVGMVASLALASKPEMVGSNTAHWSAESLRVEAFGRKGLDPDAVAEGYADDLAGYLKMVGHKHGRFKEGLLILPPPDPTSVEATDDRSPIYFAEIWNQVEANWGKIRYFPTSDVQLLRREGLGERSSIVFSHNEEVFLDVEIARSRLRRLAFEILVHVVYQPTLRSRVCDPIIQNVPLAPDRFVSISEAIATMVLNMCYELNVRDEKKLYLGLSVAQWMRGYALLQQCSQTGVALVSIGEGIGKLDPAEFSRLAVSGGLPPEASRAFVQHATFGAKSRDLWDTPLLQDEDGQLYIITSLVNSLNLAGAVISRLNTLFQQIKSKGSKFEADVREQYESVGAKTARLTYRVGSETFECDVAALWSNVLFLNECKAYVLPQPTAEDIYFFLRKQHEAAAQIVRVARHLVDDPTILEKCFPSAATAEERVLCVINQSPFWSKGFSSEVQLYDGQALSKFVEGTIDAVVHNASSKSDFPDVKGTLHFLWSGDDPTPADLKQQMFLPFQYSHEKSLWELIESEIDLTDSMAIRFSVFRRMSDPPLKRVEILETV